MRLLAVVGFVAHAVDRSFAYLFWFVPFRVPWALLLAGLLAWGSWQSAASARAIEEARPSPSPSSVAEIVRGENPAWLRIEAVVSGPHYDNSAYAPDDPVRRYYYVLRDPDRPELAVVARSERTVEQLRTRTIVARTEGDTLVELTADEAALRATPVPVDAAAAAGADAPAIRLTGTFGEARPAGDGYEYTVTDASGSVTVRSPFPPEALPVELTGIVTTDRFRMRQVLDGTPLADALAGTDHPQVRLLIEGAQPMLVEASYVPAAILGVLAGLLVASALVGYPIFRRRAAPRGVRAASLTAGEELPVEVTGRLPTPRGLVRIEGETGSLTRMPAAEAVRREWQYWGQPLTDLAPALREAMRRDDDEGRLMLHAAGGSVLLPLEPPAADLRVEAGSLERLLGGGPALRLRTGHASAVIAFASRSQRDRAWAELDRTAEKGAAGPVDSGARERDGAPPLSGAPAAWQLRFAAAFFVLAGLLVAGLGVAGLPIVGAADGASTTLWSTLLLVAVGAGLVAVGVGLQLGHDWAGGIALSTAAAGTLVALVVAASESTCLRPMGPTLQPCDAGNLAGVVIGLMVAAGFAFSAWTIRRLPDRR